MANFVLCGVIHGADEVSDVASRHPRPRLRSLWLVFLVTAMVSGPSSLALADKVFLSCSGTILLPGMSAAPFSGSVTIDLDGGSVTGMVGGFIQQNQSDYVTFGDFDPQTKTSTSGRINRVTGFLAGNVRAQASDGSTSTNNLYNLTCKPVNRVF